MSMFISSHRKATRQAQRAAVIANAQQTQLDAQNAKLGGFDQASSAAAGIPEYLTGARFSPRSHLPSIAHGFDPESGELVGRDEPTPILNGKGF